jgi:hypothetical protein
MVLRQFQPLPLAAVVVRLDVETMASLTLAAKVAAVVAWPIATPFL